MIDIDKLKAGPELDALVAEKVLGCATGERQFLGRPYPSCECTDRAHEDPLTYAERALPDYSADIAAAWRVVERLRHNKTNGLDYWAHGFELSYIDDGDEWEASFNDATGYAHPTCADTAPLAICRAALAALEVRRRNETGLA